MDARCPSCGVMNSSGSQFCAACGCDFSGLPARREPALPDPAPPKRSKALSGCVGLVCGGILGLLLGAAVALIHLNLYWRRGGNAAGTEVALVPLYAILGTILGAIAGLTGGLLVGRRR
jgi:hypothetical protein